jgi:hypothetical protein
VGVGVGCWCELLVWVVGVGFRSLGVAIIMHVKFCDSINVQIQSDQIEGRNKRIARKQLVYSFLRSGHSESEH